MQTFQKRIAKEDIIALLGSMIYATQLWLYTHTVYSRLDESAYLYKGYLFATGVYRPFQDFGPWTNKAPLSFLIPGYIQVIFGAGLRPPRYFSVFLALLALFGLWLTARRLGGKKWGAIVVWIFVITPALAKLYSPAISQGLVAFMLVWVLALSLGGDRPIWQLTLSAILAGIILLTRQNMVLVLPLLLLYIFWQYGAKAGIYSSIGGISVVIIGHLIWYPEILELWIPWLNMPGIPKFVHTLITSAYSPPTANTGKGSGSFSPTNISRYLAFFQAFRFFSILLISFVASIFLWAGKKKKWKRESAFKDSVFLIVLFSVLFLMHAWASVGRNYCVYCFHLYLGFFIVIPLFLLVISYPSWKKSVPQYLYPILILLILIITTGIGLSASNELGNPILDMQIPRIKEGQILAGSTDIMTTLSNKFQLEKKEARFYTSAGVGFSVGIIFILAIIGINLTFLRKRNYNFGYLLIFSFFIFSIIASPIITGDEKKLNYPYGDVIAAHEEAGAYLSEYIPSQSTVYWWGGTNMLPLIYIPGGVKIYPAQLNLYNNFQIGGDPLAVNRRGYWNEELRQKWIAEAEYIVIIDYLYEDKWIEILNPEEFEAHPPSTALLDDRKNSFLRVFRRK